MKALLVSIFKFAQVSGLATIVDYGIGYYLVNFLQQNATLSTIIGHIIGALVAYICCKYWVFPSDNSVKDTLQITKFAIVNLGNLALNALGVWLFTKYFDINYLTMRVLVGTMVFFIYSYIANKWFVFYRKKNV